MKIEHHIAYHLDGSVLFEFWGDSEEYYSSFLHRVDGPAYIFYNRSGNILEKEYWILDSNITEEEFNTPGFIDAFILENS